MINFFECVWYVLMCFVDSLLDVMSFGHIKTDFRHYAIREGKGE